MKVEVRAVGLKAMQEKRGLTQRKLAHDLGISQNYIPAIEANSRPGWSKPSPAGALLQMHLRGSVRGGVDRL
jgi:transcriptional regulator with XRE-family HTH domain